jgi:site-specific DNA recombinase
LLDDTGNTLADGFRDGISEHFRQEFAEASRRGKRQKARAGETIGSGTPPYGYRYSVDRKALEIDPVTMPTVHRIFEMVADGQTLHGVSKVFNEEGVPTMGGGERWYPVSMKRLIWNDAYKGVWYYGQNRVTLTPAGKNRRKIAANPEDEWIAVPVPDSSIPHEIIDRARENLSKNYRPRAQAGHYYELQGLVYCEECGLRMTTYTAGGYRYYICQSRRKFQSCDGPVRSATTTTKRKRSVGLEDEVMDYVQGLISSPDKLRAQLDAAIAAESTRNRDKDVASWLRVVDDCGKKRAKYQEMYAADVVTLDELRTKLHELDATKSQAEEHLANARAGQSRVEELRATKKAMLEAYATGIQYDGIRYFTPEMRREIYEALRLKVTVAADGNPRIQGIADAQVIRLTRGVVEYGREVEQYRQKLMVGGKVSSSKGTATVMAEVAG